MDTKQVAILAGAGLVGVMALQQGQRQAALIDQLRGSIGERDAWANRRSSEYRFGSEENRQEYTDQVSAIDEMRRRMYGGGDSTSASSSEWGA